MTVWAYYRVSTDDQTIESQKIGVVECAKRLNQRIEKEVIDDGVSGTVLAKDRNLNKILKQGKSGDKVIVAELSRLGRSTADVINTCQTFIKKGIYCYFVKQNMALDNTPMGKMMIAILSAFAEMERDLISQRTKEGLARAKAQGKKLGRKFGMSWSKLNSVKDEVIKEFKNGSSKRGLAGKYGVSWCTIQRFLQKEKIVSYEKKIINHLMIDRMPAKKWCKKNNIKYETLLTYKGQGKNLEEEAHRLKRKKNPCISCDKRNCDGCPFYKG